MTQEDKQLLLLDLCARLPYGVKVKQGGYVGELRSFDKYTISFNNSCAIPKPYLRPMSSMTEEERKIYAKLLFADLGGVCEDYYKSLDYLHKKHINYRLPPHLFIEVTEENNPYKD